jgi:copper chaperone NosL
VSTARRLGRGARAAIFAAALLLGALYVLPIWNIRLVAPQYPEGLGMQIRLHTVTGATPTDLQNINGLNHYIGMQPIEPDAIQELRYMPWIVAGLMITGMVVALAARRRAAMGWAVLYAAVAIAGLVDFWRWEYDYGHHLDFAHAIIKVPGMDYQPPLIGSRQLLNFTASSWPGAGGWIAAASLALVVWAMLRFTRAPQVIA